VDRVVRVPQAIVNVENVTPVTTMEEVVSRLTAALVKVVSNKGAPGPDGQTVGGLREQWPTAGRKLVVRLLDGSYRPGAIRRAIIPKAGGGVRGLGISNVTDRVVCEAVRQVLEPVLSRRFTGRVTGSDRAAVATRRSSRPSSISKMGTGGWSTSIWRSS
jgi:retron-type reverse transcriptase